MRLAYLGVLGVVLVGFGCGSPTKIGTPCQKDGDCNVVGQRCVPSLNGGPKVCTKPCSSNTGATGCPVGFDCGVTDPAVGPTCNKVSYAVDASGAPVLFGKSCSLDTAVCNGTGDPNAAPSCRKGRDPLADPPAPLEVDPSAYCTGSCNSDDDCPSAFRCDTDWDMTKKCLLRSICDACVINENCPSDFPVCVKGSDGNGFCSKSCNGDQDCPGAAAMLLWASCQPAVDVTGAGLNACTPRAGACVKNGELCDPCRTTSDCKDGYTCVTNDSNHERFCTKRCTNDNGCGGPNGTKCDSTGYRVCTAMPDFYPRMLTCWPE
jgi:hypothetical protein